MIHTKYWGEAVATGVFILNKIVQSSNAYKTEYIFFYYTERHIKSLHIQLLK